MRAVYYQDFPHESNFDGWIAWDWRDFGLGLAFRKEKARWEIHLQIAFLDLQVAKWRPSVRELIK